MEQRILLIAVAERVERTLAQHFVVDSVRQLSAAPELGYDVAVVGPDFASIAVCRSLVESRRATDVVLLGRDPSLEEAIAAIRGGAADFVPDGEDSDAVKTAVESVLARRTLHNELDRLREGPVSDAEFPELVGESPAMQRMRSRLAQVAHSEVTVLISGESGTGKDLVGRALHTHSKRANGPFVAVGCSTIPRHLIESEFFGHVRGAFTDASRDRLGLLHQASGGTLLLDEIGDMPLELQPKLLRALQQRAVRPLGGQDEVSFDVRVVATSSRDLEQEVASGRLRHDLYFRLNVLRIRVPPLREREGDVLLLAQHFLERVRSEGRPLKGITPAAAKALLSHDWPGNVRELEHCIQSAAAVARYDHITAADLPEAIRGQAANPEAPPGEPIPLSMVERDHILSVLRSVGGNKALAAKLLGLDRKTLYRRLKQYRAATG